MVPSYPVKNFPLLSSGLKTAASIKSSSGWNAKTKGIINITIPDLTAEKAVVIGSSLVSDAAANAAIATGGVMAEATAK